MEGTNDDRRATSNGSVQLYFSNVKRHLRTQFGFEYEEDLIGVRDFSLQFRAEHLPKTLQFVGEN